MSAYLANLSAVMHIRNGCILVIKHHVVKNMGNDSDHGSGGSSPSISSSISAAQAAAAQAAAPAASMGNEWVGADWVLCGYMLGIDWVMHGCCQGNAWMPGYCFGTAGKLFRCRLGAVLWVLFGHSLGNAWALPGYWLGTALVLVG